MSTYNASAPQGEGEGEGDGSGDPGSYQELPSFTKKVEILRALELTADQFEKEFDNIRSLPFCVGGDIQGIDLQLMEEFKKVYSLGTEQLESFIGALNEAGEDLGQYSILYYISLLENGPYQEHVKAITEPGEGGKKENDPLAREGGEGVDIFKPGPDIMGVNANWNTTNSSSPIFSVQQDDPRWDLITERSIGGYAPGEHVDPTQDVPNDTLRKAPRFLIDLLSRGKTNARGVFSAAVNGSGAIDENTMPYIDKNNEDRRKEEADKKIGRNAANPVHGNLMVKDVQTIEVHKEAEELIVEEINDYLGDSAFRLFLFRKLINYFNAEQNLAISVNDSIERKIDGMVQEFDEKDDSGEGAECINVNAPETLKNKTSDVETDMFGRTFDSVERREFELEVEKDSGTDLFKLYTIKGQLGSGDDVESDSM